MGYPSSFTADAQLGYSMMAYQSAASLFGSREGCSSFLVRLEGTCTRAHPGGGPNCPCCARPTHVAAPARYAVGELSKEKARGVFLRTERGPRAARRYAARAYAQSWDYFPQHFGWVA